MNLTTLKTGFQRAEFGAFSLCTFDAKKRRMTFEFSCVSEVDSFYFFTLVRMLPRQKVSMSVKIRNLETNFNIHILFLYLNSHFGQIFSDSS